MSGPLPMTAAELRPSIEGSGRMLPAAAYNSQQVLDWEFEHLLAGGWMCLGRADVFERPGDRRAFQVGTESILVVRGDDGILRGFFNTCRHRAHELLPVDGQASGKFIRCPYHAWVFTTSGDLFGVPPTHENDIDDPSDYSLVSLPVREWHGYVMANISGDAAPLEDAFVGIDRWLDPFDMAHLRVGDTHSYTLDANWKLIVENYHECFHCPTVHPELCVVADPDTGTTVLGDGWYVGGSVHFRDGVQTMSLDGSSEGVTIPGIPEQCVTGTMYLQVGANLLISLHPDYVMVHRLVPLSPHRTFVECQWLFPEAAFAQPGFDPAYAVDFWDITNRQDWTACESVQRGLQSRGYRPGPFSSYHEVSVHAFIAWVAQAYDTGEVPTSIKAMISEDVMATLAFPAEP
ncbi:MAG: aromatic ring-hydroxylating oxygenase subunit alpha [Actinomycetes bacterium]